MNFIQITAEGEVRLPGEQPVSNELGAFILKSLRLNATGAMEADIPQGGANEAVLVEAFDEPLVAHRCLLSTSGLLHIICPYQTEFPVGLDKLTVDEWDRFHGRTLDGVPFVLSDEAQAQLFDEVDEYDDDSLTFQSKRYEIKTWLTGENELSQEKFWTGIYLNEQPGWETNVPAPALANRIDSLRLPKSRVLVLGCGSGEDAALFARHGHVVTALDFSPEAIARAKKKFPDLNITWIEGDAFKLRDEWVASFDIVFEHTFYCAIRPERRNELADLWRKYLTPGGFLIGVFFTMEKRFGPPFGGTEMEIESRLRKSFQFLQWVRWRQSLPVRQGKELFVVAQKPYGDS